MRVHWLFEATYALLAVPTLAFAGLYFISVPVPVAAIVLMYTLAVGIVFLAPGFVDPLQAKDP